MSYRSVEKALHILRHEGWIPPVMSCSALTKNGLKERFNADGTKQKITDHTHQKLGEAEDRFYHLQLYLVPRLEYIDANGLIGAVDRAKQDILFISNESTIACGRQCSSGAAKDVKACVNRCAPEQFSRLRACDELSWLPF